MSGLYFGLLILRFGFRTALMRMNIAMMDGNVASVNVARKLLCVAFITVMAASEPTTPPSVVIDWCKPYVDERFGRGDKSAMSASVGAARMPLPNRSSNLPTTTCCTLPADASVSFIAAVITEPTAITFTRDFSTSERTPENTLLKLDTKSAKPSMAPMRVLLKPNSVCKNTGSKENTMHVDEVHRNPHVASAHTERLSTGFCTTVGNGVRD